MKFYNEDTSVWYQDDSIANPDAVTDQGNIEGFRTHDGNCQGIEKRDISEKIHDNPLSDDEMSSFLVDVKDGNISDVSETSRETVDRVRDDGGTMDGYSIGWTGTLTSESGESQEVEVISSRAPSVTPGSTSRPWSCATGDRASRTTSGRPFWAAFASRA